jgi:hypothetical protein
MGEDFGGREIETSSIASKFGGEKSGTFSGGLPDDCTGGLPPMSVPKGTTFLVVLEEISRDASNSGNSWVRVRYG